MIPWRFYMLPSWARVAIVGAVLVAAAAFCAWSWGAVISWAGRLL